ncbi:hypothetical protein M433DRAFT_149707 [Acidomyces richmondensis BFW]|nr:MAG: hypothetical protein FE78DRAFT_91680 [Acidomyces sp. 'richmondensis']KYG49754.1 hypothetical protein M433DRAFT_149707 [Acidomyces richmondensis BFW]
MGLFGSLPVMITGSELVCGTGACMHSKASIAAPAMASTCRQIRQEIMPIFFSHLIPKFVLEIMVIDRDWNTGGTKTSVEQVFVQCPAGRNDGRFEVSFSSQMPKCAVRESKIKKLVEKLNNIEPHGMVSKMVFVAQSDELAELVYRCRKYR